jgi:hypothetical protein
MNLLSTVDVRGPGKNKAAARPTFAGGRKMDVSYLLQAKRFSSAKVLL